jgi:hypothetical protein
MAFLLNESASEICSHGGDARSLPKTGNPRVKVDGSPVLTVMSQLLIAGCPNNPTGVSPLPCVLAVFAAGASRVKVMNMPVLLDARPPTNTPTGASTTVVQLQARVKGV